MNGREERKETGGRRAKLQVAGVIRGKIGGRWVKGQQGKENQQEGGKEIE